MYSSGPFSGSNSSLASGYGQPYGGEDGFEHRSVNTTSVTGPGNGTPPSHLHDRSHPFQRNAPLSSSSSRTGSSTSLSQQYYGQAGRGEHADTHAAHAAPGGHYQGAASDSFASIGMDMELPSHPSQGGGYMPPGSGGPPQPYTPHWQAPAAGGYTTHAPSHGLMPLHIPHDGQLGAPYPSEGGSYGGMPSPYAGGRAGHGRGGSAHSSPASRAHWKESGQGRQGGPGAGFYAQVAASSGYSMGAHGHGGMDRGRRSRGSRGSSGHSYSTDVGIQSVPVPRSQAMADFRAGHFYPRSVHDILGHVPEFACDQHGTRFLLHAFDIGGQQERALIFNEVHPHALSMMTDTYGNFLCQRYLEAGEMEQRVALSEVLREQVLNLSLHPLGCRVVQKALEGVPGDMKVRLAQELDGHVMKCVQDANGNHVVQQLIMQLKGEAVHFVLRTFEGNVFRLATHPYGCRIVQRVLEHCREEDSEALLVEVLQHAGDLLSDQFGNFVIQHLLRQGRPDVRSAIVSHVQGNVLSLSLHKFSSNVVERCLEYGSAREKRAIVDEILSPTIAVLLASPNHSLPEDNSGLPLTPLQILIRDQYGNYVAQRLIDTADDGQRAAMLEGLRSYAPSLRRYAYGKHILARLDKMAASSILPVGPGHAFLPAHKVMLSGASSPSMLSFTGVTVPAGRPRTPMAASYSSGHGSSTRLSVLGQHGGGDETSHISGDTIQAGSPQTLGGHLSTASSTASFGHGAVHTSWAGYSTTTGPYR